MWRLILDKPVLSIRPRAQTLHREHRRRNQELSQAAASRWAPSLGCTELRIQPAYQKEAYDHTNWFFRFHHVMAQGCPHLCWTLVHTRYRPYAMLKRFCRPPHSNELFRVCRQLLFYFFRMLVSDWMWKQLSMLQVTAPVSSFLLTCFIIYPSCCASLQEVLLGFCSLWRHASPKLDQMKVGSIGAAAY